ncbi:PAS domain-containing protein, partial [Pontiella sp.]|uniref:PAS domain-containing sensor histidine kinase n=1 Tax=Pontiella sp. TaxID=2837462 RepID=UPI003566649C
MNLFMDWKIRNAALTPIFAVVLPLLLIAAFVDSNIALKNERRALDNRLSGAAAVMESVLPRRYHDDIAHPASVSPAAYREIASRNDELCRALGLEDLYSLMLLDGTPVFTSATSIDTVAGNEPRARFLEPHPHPEIHAQAFETMETLHREFDGPRGNARAVLVPRRNAHGEKYLLVAATSPKAALARGPAKKALIITTVLLIPLILLTLAFSRWITRPLNQLSKITAAHCTGNNEPRIAVSGYREINDVARQLETMQGKYVATIAALAESLASQHDFGQSVNSSPAIVVRTLIADGFPIEYISNNIGVTGFSAEQLTSGAVEWKQFIPEEDLERVATAIQSALDAGEPGLSYEFRMSWKDGQTHWYRSWANFIKDDSESVTHLQSILIDVTERKAAEERDAVHQRELESTLAKLRDFESIVNSGPIVVFKLNLCEGPAPEFISENVAMMGYSAQEIMSGKVEFTSLVPPESLAKLRERLALAMANNEETYSIQIEARWANGEIHPYKNWYRIIRDEHGEALYLQGMSVDVSEQEALKKRDAQYQSRLKGLAQDLLEAEDRERSQLAYALHDNIGQMLAALNMKFTVLRETSDAARFADLAKQTEELLLQIMQTTKTLTWEICPTSLYETDIAAGLEHMARDLMNFFGLAVELETAGMRIELDRETAALVFRCVKELLVNIAKHSGVSHAEVGISQYGNKVHLVVSDQGKGFDPAALDNGNGT